MENLPDGVMAITNKIPEHETRKPAVLMDGLEMAGNTEGLILNPGLAAGGNVAKNYALGFVDFKRIIMTCADEYGITKPITSHDP